MAEARGWLAPAALGVLAVTAARLVLLAFSRADLFVDEAQYWLWAQSLDFGYYSKPPLIAWTIRLSTEIGGSDAEFWIRLPAPLLHAATALILGAVAARVAGRTAAIASAMIYVTLPIATLFSAGISTDTVMFPFLALALLLWLRLLEMDDARMALLAGGALGLAFLAKYAAIYYLGCAALAAALIPEARPGRRSAVLALTVFVVAISPNLIWNLANGLPTLEHTLDNADWVRAPGERAHLNLAGLAEFFVSQFAVFGPVPFAVLLALGATWRRLDARTRALLMFSLPVVALVCVQALLSRAYANWAAAAYVAGTLAIAPRLLGRRRLLTISFVLNGAVAAAIPLAATLADRLPRPDGRHLALERYVGRHEMSRAILTEARARDLEVVVAGDRDILADLFYVGRDSSFAFRAPPPPGRPKNHYEFAYPYDGGDGPALLVVRDGDPHPCPDAASPVGVLAPVEGAYRRRPQLLFVVSGEC